MNNKEHLSIALAKIKSYETYQFYGQIESVNGNLSAKDLMKISILEIFKWVRSRFRECDIPELLKTPDPDDFMRFKHAMIHSFRLEEGYLIDVLYVEEKGIWAFHLIEPDMGVKGKRRPVVGRTFETNIAFRCDEKKVECGVKTICSEPLQQELDCEVFRPQFVRNLAYNKHIKLVHFYPFQREAHGVSNEKELELLLFFIHHHERQTPVVIIIEEKNEKKEIKTADFCLKEMIEKPIHQVLMDIPMEKKATLEELIAKNHQENQWINHDKLATSLIGFSFVFFLKEEILDFFAEILPSLKVGNGDVVTIYPLMDKSLLAEDIMVYPSRKIKRSERYMKEGIDAFLDVLKSELMLYPKRNRNIKYGNVLFFMDAENEVRRLKKTEEDVFHENQNLRLEVTGKDKTIREVNKLLSDRDKKMDSVTSLEKKVRELKECIAEKTMETERLNEKIKILNINLKDQHNKRLKWPVKMKEVAKWIEEEFKDSMVLLTRARKELETCDKNINVTDLCDGICYLGDIYSRFRKGDLTLVEMNEEKSQWSVSPVSKDNDYGCQEDYLVHYKNKEEKLDLHLKKGVENNHLIRIYFFYEKEAQKIVIGSLPLHLKTRKRRT